MYEFSSFAVPPSGRSASSSGSQYPSAIEAFATRSSAIGWSRVAATFGLLSIALLGASLRWAHHWGLRADAIVVGWALATIGALAVSIPLLGATIIGKRLAKIGLVGGLVSVGALVLAGGLYAAGIDVAGACGGG
jgi:hypothetical protein